MTFWIENPSWRGHIILTLVLRTMKSHGVTNIGLCHVSFRSLPVFSLKKIGDGAYDGVADFTGTDPINKNIWLVECPGWVEGWAGGGPQRQHGRGGGGGGRGGDWWWCKIRIIIR